MQIGKAGGGNKLLGLFSFWLTWKKLRGFQCQSLAVFSASKIPKVNLIFIDQKTFELLFDAYVWIQIKRVTL